MRYVDPAIPTILTCSPDYEPYCDALIRVDLPRTLAHYHGVPGLKNVFTLLALYKGTRQYTPSTGARQQVGRFGPAVDDLLLHHCPFDPTEHLLRDDQLTDIDNRTLYLEFENGTILCAGGPSLDIFRPVEAI